MQLNKWIYRIMLYNKKEQGHSMVALFAYFGVPFSIWCIKF